MDTSRLTEAAFYTIFVCVSSGLVDKLLYKRSATAKQTLESALHHLMSAHGVLTFALMRLLEPGQPFASDTAPTSSFAIRAVLALFLWDFGYGHGVGVGSWVRHRPRISAPTRAMPSPTLHKVQVYTLYRHRGRRAAPTPST